MKKSNLVLILILMEDTLRVKQLLRTMKYIEVLILILMEDTLRDLLSMMYYKSLMSLNPYSNGRYSESEDGKICVRASYVLILILMEDTLRGTNTFSLV